MTDEVSIDPISVKVAVMAEQVKNIQKDVGSINGKMDELANKIDNHYVTKDEFNPVKSVVYGLVATILIAVLGAIVGLVVLK